MRKLILALILLFTATQIKAQVTAYGITIPSAHPRLYWNATNLAQAQSWWVANSFTPSGSDQFAAIRFMLAYQLSGNASYLTSAYNIATGQDSNIAACSTNTNPYNAGCDAYRWYGEVQVIVYDWGYNGLTSTQRSHILNNMNAWVVNNNNQPWGGPGMPGNNYYWSNLRIAAEWGIASYQENQPIADNVLKNAVQTRWQNEVTPASNMVGQLQGGLGVEGSEYGRYVGYYAGSIIFPTIQAEGRNILTESPYFIGMVYDNIYLTTPTQTLGTTRPGWDVFPWSDTEDWGGGGTAGLIYQGDFMVQMANQWPTRNLGRWARQWLNMTNSAVEQVVQSIDMGSTTLPFTSLPLDYYNPGPKYFILRNNWTSNAASLMLQLGDTYGVGHYHLDWGSFAIYLKGRWLTRESPGYAQSVGGYGGTGTLDTQLALAHQVPLIGASGATYGGGGAYGCHDSSPNVARLESQPLYAYAEVDLTGVYHNDVCNSGHQQYENTQAAKVVREFIFFRDITTILVIDRMQGDTSSRTTTFIWHCENNPTLVDATHVNCINGSEQLYNTTLFPATPTSRTIVNEACCSASAPSPSQYRIEINNTPGQTNTYQVQAFQAMDTSGTLLSPSLVDSSPSTPLTGTLTITLDSNHSAVINKGAASSGGTVTINGTQTSLTSAVEGISVSTAGVQWSNSASPSGVTIVGPITLKGVTVN